MFNRVSDLQLCRYESGLPTYDGRFSKERNPSFALSGLDCNEDEFKGEDRDEALKQCSFRTICGRNNPRCVVQQSMKQWKGKGYACRKSDKAGVACGSQVSINRMSRKQLGLKCNR